MFINYDKSTDNVYVASYRQANAVISADIIDFVNDISKDTDCCLSFDGHKSEMNALLDGSLLADCPKDIVETVYNTLAYPSTSWAEQNENQSNQFSY